MYLENGHLFATINEKTDEIVQSVEISNGRLYANKKAVSKPKSVIDVYIQNRKLYVGDKMAKVDLGQVVPTIAVAQGTHINQTGTASVSASSSGATTTFTFDYLKGAQGQKGDTGDTGPQGPAGANGTNGITPTLSIENGHLMADYDNPVT